MARFLILICLLFTQKLQSSSLFTFLNKIAPTYGTQGENRTKQWYKLIKEQNSESEWKKLHITNSFINKNITYASDLALWGKNDYWSTPIETLGSGFGDCEDFAIAKFFSLIALGVPEDKLRLMYVRQLTTNTPHMVLIYFEHPTSIPLILDNYNQKIKPANSRPDLRPIYSFNGSGLWMNKTKGKDIKVNNSRGISAWSNLILRMERGELKQPKNLL
ncbi:transglutaminase-like cysteine peptidase [Pseudoalteromonas sp. C2R02]|uniref:transglutaminase-like cysteine peptidase n=1 Tax=Pseudoalteromonas sp. C2R02 TaxID=2841565 RepID=UPI001C09E623|nr:transglutaminase-like cysteine peptidase [Pseudoalteromonas sp. C2R02]MBU2969279.1 transglutaminase-like cysteine peptidase [Pseudoalteromonas sp. C2R02]